MIELEALTLSIQPQMLLFFGLVLCFAFASNEEIILRSPPRIKRYFRLRSTKSVVAMDMASVSTRAYRYFVKI